MKAVTAPESRMPSRFSSAVFTGKATLLQARRAVTDVASGIRCYPSQPELLPYILSESRTPLWNDASVAEIALQAGKVQNLRRAAQRLNGTCIPPCDIFSFWKQVGRATTRRGYAQGRLLREGCLMPAIGGGLCQLSNALFDAALKAGLEIVERWGHSRVVPGSAASVGRDATVAWNYIDLRFRAPHTWQIEAFLTANELVVRLRGAEAVKTVPLLPISSIQAPRPSLDVGAHSCGSCEAITCFRHVGAAPTADFGRTFYFLNERWPEFEDFLKENRHANDGVALPIDSNRWKQLRSGWQLDGCDTKITATVPSLKRSLMSRYLTHSGARRLEAQLAGDREIALSLARQLPSDCTHLVIAQSLLPFLYNEGYLGGRTFDVLMTRLPLSELQRLLDSACARHPERTTLAEYRAPSHLAQAEAAALTAASRIITPHSTIAALFPNRVHKLAWQTSPMAPVTPVLASSDLTLVFPGPTAARKGAYEVRAAARALDAEVVLLGSELEGPNFWDGVRTRRAVTASQALSNFSVFVQPAFIEDRPRLLSSALATGVPVVATPACGLEQHENLHLVKPGDSTALIKVLSTIRP